MKNNKQIYCQFHQKFYCIVKSYHDEINSVKKEMKAQKKLNEWIKISVIS